MSPRLNAWSIGLSMHKNSIVASCWHLSWNWHRQFQTSVFYPAKLSSYPSCIDGKHISSTSEQCLTAYLALSTCRCALLEAIFWIQAMEHCMDFTLTAVRFSKPKKWKVVYSASKIVARSHVMRAAPAPEGVGHPKNMFHLLQKTQINVLNIGLGLAHTLVRWIEVSMWGRQSLNAVKMLGRQQVYFTWQMNLQQPVKMVGQ